MCCRNACGRLSCMEAQKPPGHKEDGVKPMMMTPPRECMMSKDPGPCEAAMPRYFYNKESKKCESFNYGGCQGNENRFDGKEACERKCMPKPKKDPCSQDKKVGPCEAAVRSFYYNRELRQCLEFVYGGCQGNENRFDSMENCKKKCMPKEKVEPMVDVFMPKCAPGNTRHHSGFLYKQCHSGHCWCVDRNGRPHPNTLTSQKKMLHCTEQGRDSKRSDNREVCPNGLPPMICHDHCKKSMCGGVKGPVKCMADPCHQCKVSFIDMKDKKVMCKPKPVKFDRKTVCNLDKDTGVCKARFMRWYYNKNTGRCEQFIYGGCKGNANNFESKEMCQHKCGQRVCKPGMEPKICETCTKKDKCKKYPEALCITDPCTCRRMFIDINTGKPVNCNKVVGLCHRANAQLKHMYIMSGMTGMEKEKQPMGKPEPGQPEGKKPGMGRPEPGGPDKKKPGMGRPEPGMGKPEPVTGKPEPGMGKPEPGMGKPEPGHKPDGSKPDMKKPTKYHMMKCTESGSFEKKQCMGEKCWCVDDKGRRTTQKGTKCASRLMERFTGKVTFKHDFKMIEGKMERFKRAFKTQMAMRMEMEEKYIRIISVKRGSIIVVYEVIRPEGFDIAAVMEDHADQISRGEFVVIFEKIEIKVDPTSSGLTEHYRQEKPNPEPSSEPTSEPTPDPEPIPMTTMIVIVCVVAAGVVIVLIMGIALLVTHRRASGKQDISQMNENKKMAFTNDYSQLQKPEMVKVT